ncbi:MAG: nucleotide-binding universal stress UspA family protein, partial [Gammaproteobacteria bacterium]
PVTLPGYAEVAIGMELLEQSRQESLNLAHKAGVSFRSAMDQQRVANESRVDEGMTSARLIEQAHYSDIVVMGQSNPGDVNDISTGLVDQVIMACGRPVMVIPYIGAQAKIGQRILLAWNGTREAVRALHDAMPLLQSAEEVIVMTVNSNDTDEHIPGADISLHLARHNINATVNSTVSKNIDIGDTLLSRASDHSADCIVMGAYGHSRFREMIMGGATRHLLQHMTVPVLMSH